MQIKRRLAAIVSVALVVGAASWATVGLASPAGAATEPGGTWGPSQPFPGLLSKTPLVSGSGAITAITCTAPGDCVAVGYEVPPSGSVATDVPVVVTETDGTWGGPLEIDGTAGLGSGTTAELGKVSCSDAGNCAAAGSYDGSGGGKLQAFYASETGGVWSTATAVGDAGQSTATSTRITGVSCATVGYCTVVGNYTTDSTSTVSGTTTTTVTDTPFTLDEAQGSWGSPQLVPALASLPPGEASAILQGVSCAGPGNCTAGGAYEGASRQLSATQPFVISESDGNWSSNTQPVTGLPSGEITTISCPDATDCTAVGSYEDSASHEQAFTADEQQGSWEPATSLASSSLLDVIFSSFVDLACSSAGNCVLADTAAIRMDDSTYEGAVADTETSSGHWGALAPVGGFPDVSTAPGIDIANSHTTGLACAPGGDCTIVGYYYPDLGSSVQGFEATTSDGVVGDEQSALPAMTSVPQGTALSCPQTGFCTLAYSVDGAPKLVNEATGATVTLKASTSRVAYGSESAETLTATVSSADGSSPAGTVTVTDGITPVCTITLADGNTCSLAATAIPAGTATLTAAYNGGPAYVTAIAMTTVTVDPPSTAGYTPLAPARILDTRNGTGGFSSPVGAGKTIALQVTGHDGVPATGVTAVVLNLTATGPTASSYVTAYPDGTARPAQGSNLNFTKGETIPNLVTVPVGADGRIDLFNSTGTVNLVADLQGYYTSTGGSGLNPDGPVRVLDTRNGTGTSIGPVGAGKSIALQVTGRDGVPATGVTAVVLNLTATGPTTSSWVIAYPDGTTRPAQGSNLNFTKGETIPNLVTVPVDSDGKIDLYNSGGSVNLVADLQGYYTSTGGSALATDGPVRVLDTRNGTGGFSSPVGAGKSVALQVTGRDGVPATGVTAVVLNLTATGPTTSGWVIAYPDGTTRPAQGSNLNFTRGETIPNLVIVPVGSDGKIDLYNSGGSVNLVADLFGYFAG